MVAHKQTEFTNSVVDFEEKEVRVIILLCFCVYGNNM